MAYPGPVNSNSWSNVSHSLNYFWLTFNYFRLGAILLSIIAEQAYQKALLATTLLICLQDWLNQTSQDNLQDFIKLCLEKIISGASVWFVSLFSLFLITMSSHLYGLHPLTFWSFCFLNHKIATIPYILQCCYPDSLCPK